MFMKKENTKPNKLNQKYKKILTFTEKGKKNTNKP